MNLKEFFKKMETKPPFHADAEIRLICDWWSAVKKEESEYFTKAETCHGELARAQSRVMFLEGELRDDPNPEQFREWVQASQFAAAVRELAGRSPFWKRRDAFDRRGAAWPAHEEKMRDLCRLAREKTQPNLNASREKDVQISKDIGSIDPIKSGETRKLESIFETCDQIETALMQDDGRGRHWHPFQSLCAILGSDIDEAVAGFSGAYQHRKTGELYALRITPEVDASNTLSQPVNGKPRELAKKTHECRSPHSQWDGSEDEFNQQFSKICS